MSSPNPLQHPDVACNGKVRFDSFTVATAVNTRHGIKPNKRRTVYKCSHCLGWHLGTPQRKTQTHAKGNR